MAHTPGGDMKPILNTFMAVCLIIIFSAVPLRAGDDQSSIPPPYKFVKVEVVPEVMKQAKPVYPEHAKEKGIEGKVMIQAYIDKEGKPIKALVDKSSGHEVLDKAALEAAKKSVYKPAVQDGKPVGVWISYAVVFALDDDSIKEADKANKKSP
jgi:protein TonB